MSIFSNFFHVKQAPILSMMGFGGGGTGTTLGGAAGGSGIEASGGQQDGITPGNGYKYHTFTAAGNATFTVTAAGTGEVDVFIVGGGGRGETGGGGAGTIIYKPAVPISAQAYPLTIGAGGGPTGASFNSPSGPYPNAEGGPSIAFGYTAAGCGHGGVHNQNGMHGDPGGSGGGGAPRNGGGTAGNAGSASGTSGGSGGAITPNVGWGNAGGAAHAANPGGYGGGGGGAGGAGTSNTHGQGGAGLAYPDFAGPLIGVPGLPGTYAAGGPKSGTEGTSNSYPTAQKLDGSGNGGGHNTPGQPAPTFDGSDGIVIIRYLE